MINVSLCAFHVMHAQALSECLFFCDEMSKSKKGSSDNVKVMARVRPCNDKEIQENGDETAFSSYP